MQIFSVRRHVSAYLEWCVRLLAEPASEILKLQVMADERADFILDGGYGPPEITEETRAACELRIVSNCR